MTCEANPFTAFTPQEPQLTQNSQACTASALIGIEPTVVQNGGDVRLPGRNARCATRV